MKNLFRTTLIAMAALTVFSCESDDDADRPEMVNEEEVITTVVLTLTSDINGAVLTSTDLDGDGPNDPVITVTGNLFQGVNYEGSIQFLNETENPAEDITEEVLEEADEHEVFYTVGGGLNAIVVKNDTDSDGNPLGLMTTFSAADVSTGTLTITLRHEPTKPNDNTLASAGGETDVQVTFPLEIE